MLEGEDTATTKTNAGADAFTASPRRVLLDKILMVFLGLWIVSTAGFYFLWFSLAFYHANRSVIDRVIDEFQL